MLRALRYRWAQGVVIGLLAALTTACAVFAPLYDRALQQSMVRTQLQDAPVGTSGIRLISQAPQTSPGRPPSQPLPGAQLADLVPRSIRPRFQPAITSSSVTIGTWPFGKAARVGTLAARSGACRHLTFTAGHCPRAANQIAISTADRHNFHWAIGDRLPVVEIVPNSPLASRPHSTLRVVGVYRAAPGAYWFGVPPTGLSGQTDSDTKRSQHDWWITVPGTLTGDGTFAHGAGGWQAMTTEADLPMRTDAVGIDQLIAMRKPVQRLVAQPVPVVGNGIGQASAAAFTGIPDLVTAAIHGRHQANTLVPLFMIQLGLLAALTLWLVLDAAIDQRRPEVALVRLRGRSTGGARRMLLGDLSPAVGAGFTAGVLLAFLLAFVARHTWLTRGTPFELRSATEWTVLATAVVLAAMLLAAVQRCATAAPAQLLRRVAPRRRGWTLGAGDLVLIVLSAAAFLAFATGSLTGAVGMAAPTLLGLAVGLLMAHLLGPSTARLGRRALRHGNVSRGLSLLQIARRPGTRKVIATITVATALLTFSCDALLVAARNRTARAGAETGAAMVLTVNGSDVGAVQAAVRQVDPRGHAVTPVVQMPSPGEGGTTTDAVLPHQFARIADFPGIDTASIAWSRLAPPPTPTIRLNGTTLRLTASSGALTATGPDPLPGAGLVPAQLRLVLLNHAGVRRIVVLGNLPVEGRHSRQMTAPIPCAQGCLLSGLEVFAPGIHPPFAGRVTLSKAAVSGHRVSLGCGHDWRNATAHPDGYLRTTSRAGGLDLSFEQSGTTQVDLVHNSVPRRLPALVAGPMPSGSTGNHLQAPGLDGVLRPMTRVGTLPYVPGSEPATTLVNLNVLQRDGAQPASGTQVQVYLARDDPALLARVTSALKDHDVGVSQVRTSAQARRVFDRSAATWALQLGIVVGIAAALIAALVLIIAIGTSWRTRSRDLAALRMTGLGHRRLSTIAVGELLPMALVSVMIGSACGVVGAHFALPDVPIFAVPPQIPVIHLATSWSGVVTACAGAVVVLTVVAALSGRWVARRAVLERIRETV